MTAEAANTDRKAIDWEGMKPHYEAGIIPLKVLGKTYGCSDAAIIKHAAKAVPRWTRNLKGKIQARADAKVSEAVVSKEVSANRKVKEAAVVEGNATLQANIRLRHRGDISKARELTMRLFGELQAQTIEDKELFAGFARADMTVDGKPVPKAAQEKLRDAIARAAALPNRAVIVKNLTEAMRVQILLERLAFGIDDKDPPDPNGGDFTERLLNARQRAAKR